MKPKTLFLLALLLLIAACVPQWGGGDAVQANLSAVGKATGDTIEFIRNAHPAGRIEYDFHTLRLVSNPNDFEQAGVNLLAYPESHPNERRAELFLYGTADPNLIFFAGGNVAIASSAGQFSAVNGGLNYTAAELTYKNAEGDLVTAGHSLADNEWQEAVFASGWGNYGGGYSTAAYRLAPTGEVALKGSIVAGTKLGAAHAFVLPAHYRPTAIMTFVVDGGRVEVWPNGDVVAIGMGQVSLDSVRFYPAGN